VRYPEQFKAFREARGLSREELAARAGCHRNTVINVESGRRAVKFATIVRLMAKMEYRATSPETKLLALLWLEAVTGIKVTQPEIPHLKPTIREEREALQHLQDEIIRQDLSPPDIALLEWAARHPPVMNSMRALRELVVDR
jgi:transcriptional regulator with XRE-family HTH domain